MRRCGVEPQRRKNALDKQQLFPNPESASYSIRYDLYSVLANSELQDMPLQNWADLPLLLLYCSVPFGVH